MREVFRDRVMTKIGSCLQAVFFFGGGGGSGGI